MACQSLVDPASSPSQVRGSIWGLKTLQDNFLPYVEALGRVMDLELLWLELNGSLSSKTLKSTWVSQIIHFTLLTQMPRFYTTLLSICWCFFVYQVLSAATIVAKHTSALCNACRLASSKTSNPVARRQFVQSAKEVANTTANLVKTIKVNSPTDQNVECKFGTEFFRHVGSCNCVYNPNLLQKYKHTFICSCLVSGLRWRFFRREQKQVPGCYDTTPRGCRKPVSLCQQPWVCEHPSSNQQWGMKYSSLLMLVCNGNGSPFFFQLSYRESWNYSLTEI